MAHTLKRSKLIDRIDCQMRNLSSINWSMKFYSIGPRNKYSNKYLLINVINIFGRKSRFPKKNRRNVFFLMDDGHEHKCKAIVLLSPLSREYSLRYLKWESPV